MAIFDSIRTLFADDDGASTVVLFNHSRRHARAPVFVCLPAMGVAASFYTPFAEALAQATGGVAVLADLRGQGDSKALALLRHFPDAKKQLALQLLDVLAR